MLTDRGYCSTHRTDHYRQDQHRRGTAAARHYDARHRRWRLRVLARDPLCRACRAIGRVTPADTADHITPIDWGGDRFDLANGQGLCHEHHSRKSGLEAHGKIVRVMVGVGLGVVGVHHAA